ncbi:uncharacterized protein [Rutidosis leptorrhynchoides]|uniref:uncharacterized protein n=1 Tax=Rutidosis leptorrhynchoides TaxID=125765 RepID=UPI003A99D9B9
MTTTLESKLKFDLMNGELSEPAVSDDKYQDWRRANSIVKSWLLNSVSPETRGSLITYRNATDIWKDIIDRFSHGSLAKIFKLQQDLHSLKQGTSSINSYFSRFKTIWSELDAYNPKLVCECISQCSCTLLPSLKAAKHRDMALYFLNGLANEFTSTRDRILASDPLPPMSQIFSAVIQAESQHSLSHISIDHTVNAMAAQTPATATNKKVTPHAQSKYFANSTSIFYSHCGKKNHIVEKCYRLIGFPPKFKFTRETALLPTQLKSRIQHSHHLFPQ